MSITLRRSLTTASALALVTTGSFSLTSASPAGAASTWPGYHADQSRTGFDPSEPSLDPATTAWTANLGGVVHGQAVVADGRVFAATETNRVVALDPHSGAVLWSQSIGTPLTNVNSVAGCGDIDPLGVTSTPVIDIATHTLYVVGEVSTGGAVVHRELVGFNTYTGAVTTTDVVDPPLPSGESNVNLLQRASLALGNGRVYVSYGGNDGDCGHYHGWVVGVDETGPANLVSFEVAANAEGGAIWLSGGAPAIDGSGNVYVSTGNPNGSFPNPAYTESVVKLSPTLGVEASFQDTSATGDLDLATGNPVLLPNGNLFAVGKTDTAFILRQSDLGLVASIPGICGSDPDGGPAYDAATNTMFVPCRNGGIQEVNLNNDTAGVRLAGANGAPILIGNDLWAVEYTSGAVTDYNATTGAVVQTLSAAGSVPVFSSPSAALGLLLVSTNSGVAAFDGPSGLPPSAPAPPAAPAAACPPAPAGSYQLAASDGGVFSFGGAPFCGSAGALPINKPVVATALDPQGGYWLAASDGGVFSYGAPFEGSAGGSPLNKPVVGMAATKDGGGYWLVASDGGIFSYGDATFDGSLGGQRLNAPIVGMAATRDGGYWLVASDGGIFSYGDATFDGSLGGQRLNAPIVGMAATRDGGGYWLVASDGGIFSYGDATFDGSLGGQRLNAPIVGMAATRDGGGYWLVASDGGIFSYGDATFDGSLGGQRLNKPVVAMAAG